MKFLVDEEDDDDEDELDFSDESDEENECNEQKPNTLPTMDDAHLKNYARLIYNLKKLMDFQFLNNDNTSHEEVSTNTSSATASCNDLLNSNSDQPLYCMKIIIIFSQLNQFKPDYWSLVNGDSQIKIKKVYFKIKKLFKMLKDSINCLFQVLISY